MPKDIKTSVILEHKTKGFDKARRDNDKFNSSLKQMKGGLSALRREFRETNKELRNLMKSFEQQSRQNAKDAVKNQKGGAFTQGLAQGGFPVPSMFLQRGPGMGRQMAGMAVGRAAGAGWGMGKAGVGGSFTGVQGLQQFLGSIPIVGGLLAGQVGKLAGYADQNIGYQKTRLGVAPYLASISEVIKEKAIRSKLGSANTSLKNIEGRPEKIKAGKAQLVEDSVLAQKGIRDAYISRETANIPEKGFLAGIIDTITGEKSRQQIEAVVKGNSKSKKAIQEYRAKVDEKYAEIMFEEMGIKNIDPKVKAKLESLSGKLRSKLRNVDPTYGITSAGLNYGGLNKQEALQSFSEFMQAGGGVATGGQAKSMQGSSFAAKTLFGVQMGTSGAFLKGGRRGGIVGGAGQADQALKTSITEGMLLGLSGSEVNQWMQQIAQGINSFQQTGIPINVSSIAKLATDIGKSGLAGTRAVAMAQGASQYIQGIGSRGITSGADLMMLRDLGGFKGGGTAKYREARAKLESMQFDVQGKNAGDITSGSPIGKALKNYMGTVGGNQATKAEMLQRLLQKWGVRGGVKEFDWLASKLMGAPMGAEQLAGAGQFAAQQQSGLGEVGALFKAGGLTGAASSMISVNAPNLRKQASMQNKQIDLGGKVVNTMQNLENNAIKVTEGFHALSKDALPALSDMMGEVSLKGIELAKTFKNMVESTGMLNGISDLL